MEQLGSMANAFSITEQRVTAFERFGEPSGTKGFGDALAASCNASVSNADGIAASETPNAAIMVAPEKIARTIDESAARYGVDPALVRAVVANESSFDPYATSKAGARGLMQLMPETAARFGVADSYDPVANVDGGTRYLRELLDRFGGDARRAVAAYNAGPGAVERYGGVPPYAETQQYVGGVLATYARYRG